MSVTPLTKKLRLHKATRALVVNPPEGYLERLGEVDARVDGEAVEGARYDFAHLFVRDRAELEEHLEGVLESLDHDALCWISYPKGSSGVETDLNRDSLWPLVAEHGFRPVTQVAVDDVWSAMRFRPEELVGR